MYTSFDSDLVKPALELNKSKIYMIYFREYFIFGTVLVFIYINRLREHYPEFYTTDIFRVDVDQNYRNGGTVSTLPKIRKMKINNQLVLNRSNESSFNSINSNDQYMILNPGDIECKSPNTAKF